MLHTQKCGVLSDGSRNCILWKTSHSRCGCGIGTSDGSFERAHETLAWKGCLRFYIRHFVFFRGFQKKIPSRSRIVAVITVAILDCKICKVSEKSYLLKTEAGPKTRNRSVIHSGRKTGKTGFFGHRPTLSFNNSGYVQDIATLKNFQTSLFHWLSMAS